MRPADQAFALVLLAEPAGAAASPFDFVGDFAGLHGLDFALPWLNFESWSDFEILAFPHLAVGVVVAAALPYLAEASLPGPEEFAKPFLAEPDEPAAELRASDSSLYQATVCQHNVDVALIYALADDTGTVERALTFSHSADDSAGLVDSSFVGAAYAASEVQGSLPASCAETLVGSVVAGASSAVAGALFVVAVVVAAAVGSVASVDSGAQWLEILLFDILSAGIGTDYSLPLQDSYVPDSFEAEGKDCLRAGSCLHLPLLPSYPLVAGVYSCRES